MRNIRYNNNNIKFRICNEYFDMEYNYPINTELSKDSKYYNFYNSSTIIINESFPFFFYGYEKNITENYSDNDTLGLANLNESQINLIKNIINMGFFLNKDRNLLNIESKFSLNKIIYDLNIEILEDFNKDREISLENIKLKDFLIASVNKLFIKKDLNINYVSKNLKDFYFKNSSQTYGYEVLLWDLNIFEFYKKIKLIYPILTLINDQPFILQKNNKLYPWEYLNNNLKYFELEFEFQKVQDFFKFFNINLVDEKIYIEKFKYINIYNNLFTNKLYKTKNCLVKNNLLFLEVKLHLLNLKNLIIEIFNQNTIYDYNSEIILNLVDRFSYLIYLNEIFGYLTILNIYGNFTMEYLLNITMGDFINILNYLNNKLYTINIDFNLIIFNILN
jgi:hypothetical protein